MASVQIIQENLPSYFPISNLYKVIGENTYFIVTVKNPIDLLDMFINVGGTTKIRHVDPGVEVFLANELGRVVDADGNLENGLTAIASTDPNTFALGHFPATITTHKEALNYLGYEIDG
ncbi:hypothetical protein HOT82_gp059 [Gordonia phage Ronaldo]|uniref:DUF7572 domain-containing protein n=3 Tax=Ronaldovirus ronaldo TaxID=2734270 RepID=A0A6B9LJR1_9CAUD|nr:hypothetical protein HOT82_gp059 [Gordonia phage Ronaldo]AXN53621.1 hypothetical protein SEA_RONALDO_59 [Gordonia phage Ronaldo]QDH48398.1 hypothetical protein SEA_ZIKO_59 [Gordonia phage Ziko]QHB38174.1 hypothetical protein SEA_VOLT_58 [Gordonia phage Volt]